ncbi:MAG: hypothetical protein JWN38_402 [Candidatus Saccharibacteria bacterium]|nr:hypothetical protein [Candidatus Saccharibacteria bacterium]
MKYGKDYAPSLVLAATLASGIGLTACGGPAETPPRPTTNTVACAYMHGLSETDPLCPAFKPTPAPAITGHSALLNHYLVMQKYPDSALITLPAGEGISVSPTDTEGNPTANVMSFDPGDIAQACSDTVENQTSFQLYVQKHRSVGQSVVTTVSELEVVALGPDAQAHFLSTLDVPKCPPPVVDHTPVLSA